MAHWRCVGCSITQQNQTNVKEITVSWHLQTVNAPSSFFSAPLGYVSNFKVISYTSTSIDVEWSPIVGATDYKLSWTTGTILNFSYFGLDLPIGVTTVYSVL